MKISERSRSAAMIADRYMFRTAPLRNIAVQPAFFHNGSFTTIEGAIRHHLECRAFGAPLRSEKAGIDRDLTRREMGPIEPVLARLDRELVGGIHLTESQIDDLTQFVTTGLLDRRALKENLCNLVPRSRPEQASSAHLRSLQRPARPRLTLY